MKHLGLCCQVRVILSPALAVGPWLKLCQWQMHLLSCSSGCRLGLGRQLGHRRQGDPTLRLLLGLLAKRFPLGLLKLFWWELGASWCSHLAPSWGDPGWECGQPGGKQNSDMEKQFPCQSWEPWTGQIRNELFSFLKLYPSAPAVMQPW